MLSNRSYYVLWRDAENEFPVHFQPFSYLAEAENFCLDLVKRGVPLSASRIVVRLFVAGDGTTF